MSQWTVSQPDKITFDEPVNTLNVRIVGGAANVVATEGPSRLEVNELDGEPLLITLENGVLTVSYQDFSWSEFGEVMKSVQSAKHFLGSLRRGRRAVVSLAVPADSAVEVAMVSADTTISGISGKVAVHGVRGTTTLVGLAGQTKANTVSGDVDAQEVAGELEVNTVSGGLTVVAGTADKVQANTVSGGVTLDLDNATPTDIRIATVTGPVGIRLPSLADTLVEAGTSSGDLTSSFEQLTVAGTWGAKRLTGRLGDGNGKLQVTTVSGAVTVLRRPDTEDDIPHVIKELPAGPDLTKEA